MTDYITLNPELYADIINNYVSASILKALDEDNKILILINPKNVQLIMKKTGYKFHGVALRNDNKTTQLLVGIMDVKNKEGILLTDSFSSTCDTVHDVGLIKKRVIAKYPVLLEKIKSDKIINVFE